MKSKHTVRKETLVHLTWLGINSTTTPSPTPSLVYDDLNYTTNFSLIWFFTSQSTIFQLWRDGSFWVESVLSKDLCVLLKDATQWRWWGSTLRPLCLVSSTLPMSHCAPWIIPLKLTFEYAMLKRVKKITIFMLESISLFGLMTAHTK